MSHTPAAGSTVRRRPVLSLGLAAVGGVLLFVTIRRVGWAEVEAGLRATGWWLVPVLVLGGLRFGARAAAWRACAAPAHLSLPRAFAAVVSGDALGNLTPLGLLASEPAKVLFVRGRLDTVAAVSSVAVENAFYMASVLVMIGAGALVFSNRAGLPDPLRAGAAAVIGAVVAGGLVALWIARRRPAILTRVSHALSRWTGRGVQAADRMLAVERHFYGVLTWPAARLVRVAAWEALFHAAAVAEVFAVLRVLNTGRPITLVDAFVLETAGRLIVVAFKFVPYRLGVDEAGTALVARTLALDPAAGVALALVRRVRVLFWNGIGLLLLARHRPD